MAARRANVTNAAIELAFVVVAGVLGAYHAPWWTLFILADLMIVYWMWNRRVGIKEIEALGARKLAAAIALSLVLITVVLTGAYWIGRSLFGVVA